MLIEVHIIQNHAPSNLNRDDSGSPKSAMFGGYRRARISSQCLKRCFRTSKTFIAELDGVPGERQLGMHTRSMPHEIQRRLLNHAASLSDAELKARFEDWADRSRAGLAAILGRGGGGESAEGGDTEEASASGATESGGDSSGETDEAVEEAADATEPRKSDKLNTAQSIFWRETELQALFNAYRKRIEWHGDVPDAMRSAFSDKGEVKPSEMLKAARTLSGDTTFARETNAILQAVAPDGGEGKKKRDEEKLLASNLANLILDRFDPKAVLKSAGLRPDGIPVDMALFGRMVASPLMHNVEGSSQFAHAISTHEWAREFDLWTRVDDRRDRRLDWYQDAYGSEPIPEGTDGMGDAEFTSACFYSYFNVDFDALVDNLTGKALDRSLDDRADRKKAREWACKAVVGLVQAAVFERPTGKFKSMTTASVPTLVLVEVRHSHVAVSYADAFVKPVDPKNEETTNDVGQIQRLDLPKESARRLIEEANRISRAFGRAAQARLLFTGGHEIGASLEAEASGPSSDEQSTGTNPNPTAGVGEPTSKSVNTIKELVTRLRTALSCPASEERVGGQPPDG